MRVDIIHVSNHRMRSLFICCCDCLNSDCVQFTLAFVGDLPATCFFILLDQSHLLKLLDNVPQDLTRALCVNVRARSTAELTSVNLAKGADTDTSTDVDL